MRFSNIAIAALSLPLSTGEANKDEVSVGMYDAYGNFFHQHITGRHANEIVFGDASTDDFLPIDLPENPPPSSAAVVELKNPPNYVEFSERSGASNESLDDPIDLGVLRELAGKPMKCVSNVVINETGELLAKDFQDLVDSCYDSHNYYFSYCPERYNVTLECWNTTLVMNMSYAFAGHFYTQYDDISMWDVSNVVDMHAMFLRNENFYLDLSRWQTGKVTDMANMFLGAYDFESDLSLWETGKVTDMSGMFDGAIYFNSDLSLWDTGKVTDMSYMFYNAVDFTSDLSLWETGKVTDMSYMFFVAIYFNSDLSLWETGKVTDMSFMFYDAMDFTSDISLWETGKVTDMSYMFDSAISFNSDLSSWKTGNVTDTKFMFAGAKSFNQNLASWEIGKVTDTSFMFFGAESFNQCLGSWAARTPDSVDTKRMFKRSSCANQSDPDPQKGPWCQGFEERCFAACSDAEDFRFGKKEKSCDSINNITAPTEKKLKKKIRRVCRKKVFPDEGATGKKIRVRDVCQEACGKRGFGPGKKCDKFF